MLVIILLKEGIASNKGPIVKANTIENNVSLSRKKLKNKIMIILAKQQKSKQKYYSFVFMYR